MNQITQLKKCLASIYLFREMYNKEKDIYDILSEFLIDVILAEGKNQFGSPEITQLLNKRFGFDIPEAVIKNSLKRIPSIKRENKLYYIEKTFRVEQTISKRCIEIEYQNNEIIEQLFNYIIEKIKRDISDSEKNNIVDSFCNFLLDQQTRNDQYSKYISSFIISNSSKKTFIDSLNTIKEGVILYSGLLYSPEEHNKTSWDTDLVIFLDTEILFSIAGYNGELFLSLTKDFLSLVQEINKKSQSSIKRNRIELKYFSEIKEEIYSYFKAAEHLIIEDRRLFQKKAAMVSILDGCTTKADVAQKNALFYELLTRHSINEDTKKNYYQTTNHPFNIEETRIIEKLKADLRSETSNADIEYGLNLLNKINILRKGNNIGFENVKYILLTANGLYLEIANNSEIKKEGEVPFATSLDYLIDKMWIKLNKGFGKGTTPKSFDVITKSQIVITVQMNISLASKFHELEKRYKEKNIDETQANSVLIELRRFIRKPESIDKNSVDEIMLFTEESIDDYIRDHNHLKTIAKERAEENEKLKKEVEEKNALLKLFIEKDEVVKQKKLKRMNLFKKTLFLTGFLVILAVAIIFYLKKNHPIIAMLLFIFGFIGTVTGILRFLGFDFKRIKKMFVNNDE